MTGDKGEPEDVLWGIFSHRDTLSPVFCAVCHWSLDGLGDKVSDLVLFDPWRATSASSTILAPMRFGKILVW